jgi:uncharacterized protein YjbI with pentapeptide repeats
MKEISEEKLKAIIDSHGKWLRDEDGGERADLQGAYLQDADLQGAYLQDAYLQGAYLQGADLRYADLPEGFYQVSNIGSVGRSTTYDSVNDQVICGCWNDKNGNTLENFEKRVKNEYGKSVTNPNERYYAEYMAAIKFFKTMKKECAKNE